MSLAAHAPRKFKFHACLLSFLIESGKTLRRSGVEKLRSARYKNSGDGWPEKRHLTVLGNGATRLGRRIYAPAHILPIKIALGSWF